MSKSLTFGRIAATALFAIVALFIGINTAFADSTVVISGNTSAGENQPGWMFNRDASTDTPFEFNTAQHSIGAGALYVLPIGANAADKFIAEDFINAPIADVDSISYDFLIGSGGDATDEEQFYMNVYANFGQSDDLKFYDCRYNIVPTTGSTANFTTVTFDPSLPYDVTTRTGGSASPFTCPAIPDDMNTLSPGSNIRAYSISVGDTSVSDVGLDGYLDKVVVDMAEVTTYDFEAAPTPTVDVTIIKYVDGAHATEANADSATFPMQATYDFTNDQFPGGIAGSDPYDIGPTGNNTPEAYEAKTLDFYQGADYSMYERMDTAVVGATCQDGKPFALEGYKIGDTLVDAQNAVVSPTAPSFTDMQADKYVIVSNVKCVAPTPDVKVTINKFIDGAMATAGTANNSAFPMTATWNATNIGPGNGAYDLDADGFNGDPTPYQAITSMMTSGADYSTSETTGGSVVGATCQDGKPFALAGYSWGDSFAAAQAAATTTQAPALTNITTDKYVIVRNIKCVQQPPAPQLPTNACATPGVAPQGYTLRNGTSKSDSVTLAPNTMFVGKGGADSVTAGPGNYIVCLGSAADSVSLGAGQSVVDGGGGSNSITLGNGTGHYVKTGSANDVITTGNGNDTINAGGGNNSITTRAGDDNITTGGGNDTVNAGADTDTCSLGGGNNNPTGCEL